MLKWIHISLLSALLLTVANINAGSAVNQSFDFYGHTVSTQSDPQLYSFKLYKLSQKEITQNMTFFRSGSLTSTAKSLERTAQFYRLDDLGLSLMVDKYAERIAGNNNEKIFIKYILLKELNYDVILTRTDGILNCLGNTSFKPGRYIYINYANKVYKDLNFNNRTNYPKHLVYMDTKRTYRVLSRNELKLPQINAITTHKNFEVTYGFNTQVYHARSNKSITNYLGDLPLFNVGFTFTRMPLSREIKQSVMSDLRETIDTMSRIDAIKYLLAFTQQVTPYGSDYDKYGEELYYYPEQTLMATTADCEDKAMLLAYLLKELVQVNSIGLYFENDEHLSLAIEMPGYKGSNSFDYQNKNYVSCEPTAKTPKLGQSQFSLKRVTEVMPL